jgi:hypothetical protein
MKEICARSCITSSRLFPTITVTPHILKHTKYNQSIDYNAFMQFSVNNQLKVERIYCLSPTIPSVRTSNEQSDSDSTSSESEQDWYYNPDVYMSLISAQCAIDQFPSKFEFTQDQLQQQLIKLLKSVHVLHQAGYAHCDIRAPNVVINKRFIHAIPEPRHNQD